ncbi:MAG: SurA N-terminal domain-containing protein [Deltaproteobacteria bacterium]|nr:SurA N-terminal domain-containing protein [Deltaproteobacteria bacterium]
MRATAVLLALAALVVAPARADVIEQVVATVNDEAIFLSDLRRQAVPFLPRVMSAPTQEERMTGLRALYQEILTKLIDQELIEQAAREMQVRVTSRDVDRAVLNVIRQNGLSEEEFWEAVRGQGFTQAQYRADVQKQLLRLKVLNQRVRGRVNITEADVRRRYEQRLRQANRSVRFRTSHLYLSLPEGASATDVRSVREEAEEIREELTAENFADMIREYGGGELGWLSQGDLPEDLEQELLTLEDQEISDPVQGERGFHIFFLHERERGGSDLPEFDAVKEQLYQQMMERAMVRQEETFLRELRRDAIITRKEL